MTLPLNTSFPYYETTVQQVHNSVSAAKRSGLRELSELLFETTAIDVKKKKKLHNWERVCTKKNSGARYERPKMYTHTFFLFMSCFFFVYFISLHCRLLALLRALLIRNYTTTSFGCILSFPLFFLLLFS